MIERGPEETRSSKRTVIPVMIVVALVAVAAFGNFVGTQFFWHIGKSNTSQTAMETMLCLALGLLIAQPCLLSIWCALAKQAVVVRVPVSIGILFGLTCLFIMTFRFLDGGSGMPAEVPFVFLAIAFSVVVVIGIPLWIFRWKSGRSIGLDDQSETEIEASQFGIRHLFILTTVTAILIPIAQRTFAMGGFEGGAPWLEIACFLLLYTMLAWLVSMLSIALVFQSESRFKTAVLMSIAVLVCPSLVVVLLANSFNSFSRFSAHDLINSIGFTISMASGICLVLGIFYQLGYRLQR